MMDNQNHGVATLAGGCFWCLEAVFLELRGVERIGSGYSGGQVPNPSYQQVCAGTTGHAEVVQITFDPTAISFRELLEVFFTIHDPTTPDRQGYDVGPQYRSAIFYHDPAQKTVAEEVIAELENEGIWKSPIITELEPFTEFYPAEEYHQQYFMKNSNQPYCQLIIEPKVAKVRERYMARLKS